MVLSIDVRISFTEAGSTLSDASWAHAKSLSSWPPSDAGGQLPSVADSGVSGLAGSGVRKREGASLGESVPFRLQLVKLAIPNLRVEILNPL